MTAASTSTDPDQGAPSGRNLASAVILAVALAVGFIWALVVGQAAVTIYITLFIGLGVVETSATLRQHGIAPMVVVLLVTTIVMAGATLRVDHLGQVLGVLVLLLGSGLWVLVGSRRSNVLARMGVTVLLGLWLPLLGSFSILLAGLEDGRLVLFLVVACTAMADIGAYAFGSLLGRHKIAPSVSPNKSWEGLVGGLAVAAGIGWLLAGVLYPLVDEQAGLPVDQAVVVGVACALTGFGGDLFESLVKRDLGIKDFGAMLPGHGGILDRFDALLVAFPVGWLLMVTW